MVDLSCKTVRRSFDDHDQLTEITDPYLRQILLARGVDKYADLDLSLKSLLHYNTMKGITEACQVIYEAMQANRLIFIVGDYDVDGATSTALAVRALRQFGYPKVGYFIPDRVSMGYGLSAEIVDTLYNQTKVDLIITVDNGITSFDGVCRAKELGIKVLITDHHLASDNVPPADAIVNPNQKGCEFPSKCLAGVGVIFYVMIALRSYLVGKGWFDKLQLPVPRMSAYLDLVAVGSIADVVSLDHNNRILIQHGINLIRRGQGCLCFPLMLLRINKDPSQVSESDICHFVAPLLNAAGRIDNMSIAIQCLLTDNHDEINQLVTQLLAVNNRRRAMEHVMRDKAIESICNIDMTNLNSIVLYDPCFHQGIIGLVASRIKELYSRPTVVFAQAIGGELKGSIRSVTGINIKSVLEELSQEHEGLILAFGGHAMAAGLTIREENLEAFTVAFRQCLDRYLSTESLVKIIMTDGFLPVDHITVEFAKTVKEIGPWGNNFEYPVFEGDFIIQKFKFIHEGKHLKLTVTPLNSHFEFSAMLFNVPKEMVHYDLWHRLVRLCYRLELNNWHGNFYLQLVVENFAIAE